MADIVVYDGSFATWRNYQGQFYGVNKMAADLKNYVTGGRTNVTVHYGYDITGFGSVGSP